MNVDSLHRRGSTFFYRRFPAKKEGSGEVGSSSEPCRSKGGRGSVFSRPDANAARAVFERDADFFETVADRVGGGEVLILLGVFTQFNQQIHERFDERIVLLRVFLDGLAEESQRERQFFEDCRCGDERGARGLRFGARLGLKRVGFAEFYM